MTVCVAALAADSQAIVCVADKAVTYGSYIQWDADSTKIVRLSTSGVLVLVSGGEESISRIIPRLNSDQAIGQSTRHTAIFCEAQMKDCLWELISTNFLVPRMLTRDEYVAAISGPSINPYIHALADEIARFEMPCGLLLCGFNSIDEAYIVQVGSPGIAVDLTRTGFGAVGSGWEKAVSRILFSESKRSHPIERVLYDTFDAKANAEMAIGVGYEWDAEVIVKGKNQTEVVPKEIKEIIERVWAKFNRSPFEKYNPREDVPPPPKDWKQRLSDYANKVRASLPAPTSP